MVNVSANLSAIQPASAWMRSVLSRSVPSVAGTARFADAADYLPDVFYVGVEEELGIRQTWTNDFLVTEIICCGSFDSILATKIKFGRVCRRSRTPGSTSGHLSWCKQRFRRHREEFLFEFCGQHNRHSTSEATSSNRLSLKSALPPSYAPLLRHRL